MSEYIGRVRPSFKDFTEPLRGQTPDDYRPNKALLPFPLTQQCRGYPLLGELLVIASDGVRVRLWKPITWQPRFPSNHPSSSARLNVLHKNIRKEQDLLLCLVVDAAIIKIWPEIVISPFGVVDKGDGDPQVTGRTIHDRSFPEDGSVNDCTDPANVPKASFEHCSRIAREIVRCKQENPECQIEVMAGDVASAYRNACIHSKCVHLFGGHISEDDAIAIDLSAALGWSGSAGIYGVLGRAVAFRHGHNTNPGHPTGFFSYQWVDDHVNVAADTGSRCADIDRSLRFTMTAVMGPAAINEEKFTPWRTRLKVLGLIFDTLAATVTIPPAK
ncbi:hypothetical protein PF002_g5079 [Phytophthora fragariae]|nr:hypothetical protein PF009_g4500 [Phytophthora fragariae]KAE9087058.1 hypothetical protein PF006_g25892 [Phytophthora fragariae]KAE9117588.1 hypothetical protein PF007_g9216 [Phytophthora fragariae]KAE9249845.1 hypothetical protein PF002_g5079 [Phytophthora fragariae]KAE9276219.1 hypothetical protein PF001_g26233 [Phytophthora fragariae]